MLKTTIFDIEKKPLLIPPPNNNNYYPQKMKHQLQKVETEQL